MSIGGAEQINNMCWVYILQSDKNGKYYIGSTIDVDRRLAEHNSGKTKSLIKLLPLRMVFSQKFESAIDAQRMEMKLKKFKNRTILERIIRDGEIKASSARGS